jgi:transcriptional regulator with XRE-family HTH domain
LRSAVRQLRMAMGKSQTEFGALIGKGLATIQRYEALVPPRGKVLSDLVLLAEQNSQPGLAALFRSALEQEIGGLRAALGIGKLQEAVLKATAQLQQLERKLPRNPDAIKRRLKAIEAGLKEAVAVAPDLAPPAEPPDSMEEE